MLDLKGRCLLAGLLALGLAPVQAEWLKVTETAQSAFYIDPSLSRTAGTNITIWVLRDHAGVRYGTSGAFLSSRDQIEVDCARRRMRLLYSSDHPQAMGQGKFIHSEHGPMSWNGVDPRSTLNRIVSLACAQR